MLSKTNLVKMQKQQKQESSIKYNFNLLFQYILKYAVVQYAVVQYA